MVSPFTVTLPTGRASFESVIRSWDESPQRALSVELIGEPTLYGIWQPKWAANENDFDVEVVSFGWASQSNTGNPNPATRSKLSAAQAADVNALIVELIGNVEVRKKVTPFSSKGGRFLGGIEFNENWILLRD
jgi:hypothetical protein